MSLVAGTRLGPYEIVAPLGAGGMGEVYRARDTRLERTVAIKILPAHLSGDPIRKQRFEREAKTISSLNHPNICVVYDVGHQDGVDYLVMECIEGDTLAERLEKGPLPVEQVLKYGAQIADALAKAHRSGVVHRDLKPGNIMLPATGAKLLDFGLAKPAVPLVSGANLTAATQTTPMTEEGTIVGTFQYMSPEQVEGKDLDGRSDIFSLGAVLYEMVTGQRAFTGKNPLNVASAILEKEPTPMSSIKPMTPPALDHAVKKCLAKLPDERWQSASDLASELTWALEARLEVGVPAPVAWQRKLCERLILVAAAVLATTVVLALWRPWRSETSARQLVRLSAELPPGTSMDRFRGAQLAFSPDGTRIVVAHSDATGKLHLVMRSLDQSQFAPLPGVDFGYMPFFSPDGHWIGFFADGKLKRIPVQGGEPVTLSDVPDPRGASWGDDGNIVAAFNGGSTGLVKVPSGGGAPTAVTQLSREKGETINAWPQVLPGSQAALFTAFGANYTDGQIEVVSFKTGERKILQSGGAFGRYLPSGHLLYIHQNTLFAVPFDLSRLAVLGAPQPVLEDINMNWLGGADFDFSQTGTLVFVNSKAQPLPYSIWWLDSSGQTRALHLTPGLYENPRFSPDGKRLAFEVPTNPARADIWVKDLERQTLSRLTHLPGRNNSPLWTLDGNSIVFESSHQVAPGIYWIRADGAGEAQRLTDGKTRQVPCSFSPDGKRLAYQQYRVGTFGDTEIWTAPVEGDRNHPRLGIAEPFLQTSFSERHPAFSPDGHWLAYASKESGTYELYVRPFPEPEGKWQISSGGGDYPIWARSGRKLFFLTPDWRIMFVDYAVAAGSFAAGKPQMWSQKNLEFLGVNYPYDLAPDGKRFAVVVNPGEAADQEQKRTDSVTILLHFFDELGLKMPVGKN